MKTNSKNFNEKFLSDFKQIYLNPSKIDYFLKHNSDYIEEDIKRKFKKLNLDHNFAIYSIGGFGRGEIFPSSDVDISIIETNHPKNYSNLEIFISSLWDEGYKVGHSVRSIKDIKKITKSDVSEFTSYLTRKPILSDRNLDKLVSKTLSNLWTSTKFYKAKFLEQNNRHREFFLSSSNLEPNLKESPGSSRDFHSALWILQHCYGLKTVDDILNLSFFKDEFLIARNAYNFIKVLRFITNLFTKNNKLDFETQIKIAKRTSSGKLNQSNKALVEKMMAKYYEHAHYISHFNTLIYQFFEEKRYSIKNKKGLYKIGSKVGFANVSLEENKELIFKIFLEIGNNKKINAVDVQTSIMLKKNNYLIDNDFRKNAHFAEQFLNILRSKYNLSSILKAMRDLGLLQRYIPEFSNVVGQMQFDLFHIYTVDEHTFKVVRNMRQMKIFNQKGFELEHELINKLPKIELLFIAGLFHDLGKGKGGDHSKIGSEACYKFSRRLGLSKVDSNLTSWLVEKHLEMSSVSQKKDISEQETIKDFAETVMHSERLDYLYLLTINDIRATNPSLWNGWKHQLLRELYSKTRLKINKEPIQTSNEITIEKKKYIIEQLDESKIKMIKHYLSLFDNSYFNKNSIDSLQWQVKLYATYPDQDLIIECRKIFQNLVEIFIKAHNTDGLFYRLTKALEESNLDVIDANIFTSNDESFAANTFITKNIYHSREFTKVELNDLAERIRKKLEKKHTKLTIPRKIEKKSKFEKVVKISDSIIQDRNKNIITIETSNKSGLLSKIASVFFENKISIFSARINTLGERVEDTFEISNLDKSVIKQNKIKKIIDALHEVV